MPLYSGPLSNAAEINAAIAQVSRDNMNNPDYPTGAVTISISSSTAIVLDAPIVMKSRVYVECDSGLLFKRNPSADGAKSYCLTADDDVSDSAWVNGTFERQPTNPGETISTYENGTMFQLAGSRLTIENVTLRHWMKGRAFDVNGDDIVIKGCFSEQPEKRLGTGGIRVFGGRGFRCVGGKIEAYDDALVFAPGPPSVFGRGDRDIEDGAFINVVVDGVRAINASLGADGITDPELGSWAQSTLHRYATASVRNVRFIGITGIARGIPAGVNPNTEVFQREGGKAIKVVNESSSGTVQDVLIQDCTIECAFHIDQPVVVGNYAGGVSDVRLENVSVVKYLDKPENVQTVARQPVNLFGVHNFSWVGGRIDPPFVGNKVTVFLEGVRNALFSRLSVDATNSDTFYARSSTPPATNNFGLVARGCTGIKIQHCDIKVAADYAGVRLRSTDDSDIEHCTFSLAGAGSSLTAATKAVVIANDCAYNKVQFNYLQALENDAGLSHVRPISYLAPATMWLTPNDVADPINFDFASGVVKPDTLFGRNLLALGTDVAASPVIDPMSAVIVRLTATAATSVSSMLGNVAGRMVSLVNASTQTITILDNSGSVTAQRFRLGGNRVLAPGASLTVWYDADPAVLRWRPID